MDNFSELKFIDTPSLKFHHSKDGVIAFYQNNKFILGHLSISKEGAEFNDETYIEYSKAVLKFNCSVRNVPLHKIEQPIPIFSNKIINDYSPFYKYISTDIFEKYIRKGMWQLGAIEQYRTIENIKQRDEFEGYSFLNLNINNHIVSSICNTGFNYLIFCGTRSSKSLIHKEQFGDKELYFPNAKSFADNICKAIGAKRYYIQNVQYNTLKLYINKNKISNPDLDVSNILTPLYFDIIKEHFVFPSLFVKPESFKQENEVRIVFEMPKDYYKPLRFEHKGLLKMIKY